MELYQTMAQLRVFYLVMDARTVRPYSLWAKVAFTDEGSLGSLHRLTADLQARTSSKIASQLFPLDCGWWF